MHISHVHKTADTPYLANKHTLAEVAMTYTIDATEENLAISIAIEDLKTVEAFLAQKRYTSGAETGKIDLGCTATVSGNVITFTPHATNWPHTPGHEIFILAYGKP